MSSRGVGGAFGGAEAYCMGFCGLSLFWGWGFCGVPSPALFPIPPAWALNYVALPPPPPISQPAILSPAYFSPAPHCPFPPLPYRSQKFCAFVYLPPSPPSQPASVGAGYAPSLYDPPPRQGQGRPRRKGLVTPGQEGAAQYGACYSLPPLMLHSILV